MKELIFATILLASTVCYSDDVVSKVDDNTLKITSTTEVNIAYSELQAKRESISVELQRAQNNVNSLTALLAKIDKLISDADKAGVKPKEEVKEVTP